MTGIITGELIRQIRRRKGWQQSYLQGLAKTPATITTTLSRIENLRQHPGDKTLDDLMDILELAKNTFFCPYMDGQTTETILLREQIVYYLNIIEHDPEAYGLAEKQLEALAQMLESDSLLNRQFILACRARLALFKGEYANAAGLAGEGILLTYPEFDREGFDGGLLLFEEAELLRCIAIAESKTGKPAQAIALLEQMLAGSDNAPIWDSDKEHANLRTMVALARIWVETGHYEKALPLCTEGIAVTVRLCAAFYTPELSWYKTLCHHHLKQREECIRQAKYTYFGYAIMEMKEKRDRVLRDAKALTGLDITTFGTENLPATPLTAYAPTAPKRRGTANVQTIGELLRHFRKEAGLTAKAVYNGLCTQGYYSKIEAGKVKNMDSLLMGELFYRTGRDYRAYFYVFFNEEDFILSNLRYTISMKKLTHDYDAFPPLLEELRRRAVSHSHLYERLIRQNKIARYTRSPEKYTPELKEELEAILRITIPDYNEEHIDRYPLSATEKSLLWTMMNYYLYNKDDARRVAVAKRTLESIEKSYAFDEPLKVLFSKDFRFHYILGMCMLGRVDEVWGEMEIIRKQVATYCITDTLADVAGVYATLLHQAGRAEEALPHFAMGVNFMGLINNVAYESNKKEVEQVYGISLD